MTDASLEREVGRKPSLNPVLRRIVLLGTPLVAAADVAFLHPVLAGDVRTELFPVADLWLILHVVQLVLFGLLGMAAYLLLDGVPGILATVSRVCVAFYVVFYNAGDAVAGISTGILARGAADLSAREQAAVAWAISRLFEDPTKQLLFFIGTYAWISGLIAAVFALYLAGAPRLPLAPLALAALPYIDFFGFDHSPPFNPIALVLFFLAALWLELTWRAPEALPAEKPDSQLPAPEILDR